MASTSTGLGLPPSEELVADPAEMELRISIGLEDEDWTGATGEVEGEDEEAGAGVVSLSVGSSGVPFGITGKGVEFTTASARVFGVAV